MRTPFRIGLLFTILSLSIGGYSQSSTVDSLKMIVQNENEDADIMKAWESLGHIYMNENLLDSSTIAFEKVLAIASAIGDRKTEARALTFLGSSAADQANSGQALRFFFRSMQIYEELNLPEGRTEVNLNLQSIYRGAGDYKNALRHALIAKKELVGNTELEGVGFFSGIRLLPLVLAEIGENYQHMNKLDSAEYYTRQSIDEQLIFNEGTWNFPIYLLGKIQARQGKHSEALRNYRMAIPLAIKNYLFKDTLDIYNSIAELYKETGKFDSAIYYGKAITAKKFLNIGILLTAETTLADVYKLMHNTDSAFKYLELSSVLKDSIYSAERQKEFQNAIFNEQLREKESLEQQEELKRKIVIYTLIIGLVTLVIVALLLYRNNLHKQRAKVKIEKAYDDLKAAQKQLIQSEKMASLGELTAGIAHEIQNPLNFVNNFSEVNTELIDELKKDLGAGDVKSAENLANGIGENEAKITHHGKRADAIVKSMLLHSRASSGQKEVTDLNELCEEYIRLAYHGYRAKGKSFNVTFEKQLDPSLPKIAVVPQDIGRVILNLINNASYAVNEKSKAEIPGYAPTVKVVTRNLGDKVEIRIEDNGMGIPESVKEKIFQPFFSTKPTGQGTGLGLSLSYDIIKAHEGTLEVISNEGEGSEFTIHLLL